jgi:hypothetical protein
MLRVKTDYTPAAGTEFIWAADWPGEGDRNDASDTGQNRWPAPDKIRGYEPADQYTDLRYDPATDNSPKRPDEERNFWDRL